MTSPGTNEHGVTLSLEYEDPLMPRISPDAVIRRGARVRRRRRVVRASGTLVAAVIAAAVVIPVLRGTPPPAERAAVSPFRLLAATPAYQQHLPAGTPVEVDKSATGWRSFAWLSADDQFCSGSIGVPPQDRSAVAITCVKPVSFGSPKSGPPYKAFAAATEPVFQVLPPPDANGDKVLIIGLARSDVASIEIRFLRSDVSAAVYPIKVAGAIKAVAYAAWLPLEGKTSYGTGNITAFIARNASGRILRS